ncbi:MAG: preprotein translocase subunit SecY [Lachnospiraceae bacterium]|jgi:preprotein translocase subunit SecY|uniref:preprotein translocase subunit SecY n=1 Tax=Clostridium sp. (strain SY8519) TaxID=1042156 RepID=UPI0002171E3C|nr:preprotein translocase subunit SecY [Clostridium sp. SY8519]MCI1655674.1 preprotein translocase subunit SecY [Lachnospiraceae bacterium]MCI1656617.1 preprotein translocase subunit SecY [Lachnospiraceae bacterium]MCI2195099.1 preprotein translocase subunit SecY [Lachnospiraceae bacterium]BAK47775.1 preprotein translocase subunit SecY [Clostridium sp. SY8519]
MLEKVRNAFKLKEIRQRIIFTLLVLVVVRIGSQIPMPGVDGDFFSNWLKQNVGQSFGFFDAITGGSFENMSVFALNITPYITSSIIIQLLTIAIPKLEELQRDGEEGRKKITQITRVLTVILALGESLAMAIGFGRQGYLTEFNALNIILAVATLTAGSTILMWLGERITERGVGNGISIVLTINIISRIPSDMGSLWEQFVKGKEIQYMVLYGAIIVAIILAVTILVVVLQGAERHIPVQYSRKVFGRKQVGGSSTHIPLKVNTAGVIPIIFAQSIMMFPVVIAQLAGKSGATGVPGFILKLLSQSNWCDPSKPIYSIGLAVYILLVIAFAYFYTTITFNPLEIADNMKKSGGFIPGIRPGKPTSDYLQNMLSYIVFIGAIGLSIVAVIPIFFEGVFNANVSFGGTSLIIIVGVIIETLKQIDSQMLVRNYTGFLDN